MGRDLYENFPRARAVFEEADEALGFPLSKLCFEGPATELQLTANTQPAILVVSVAAAAVLRERGIEPALAAGHSLGEYSALVDARALSLSGAVRLVRKRGLYMQEAVPVGVGAMAALLGGKPGAAEAICREAAQGEVCAPANLNSPGQVVIAGHQAAVARAAEAAPKYGVRRVVMLNVSAPFHCALMQPAAERLARDLADTEILNAEIPVIRNIDGAAVMDAEEIRDGLTRQVVSPVRWEQSMRNLLGEGVNLMIEAGPGKVLCGLMRQIDRQTRCLHVEDSASLGETLTEARASER